MKNLPTHQTLVQNKNAIVIKNKEFPGSITDFKIDDKIYVYTNGNEFFGSHDKKSWLVLNVDDFKLLEEDKMNIYFIENNDMTPPSWSSCFSHALIIAENEEHAKVLLFDYEDKHMHYKMKNLSIKKIEA